MRVLVFSLHLRASLVEMELFSQTREQGAELVCRCVSRYLLRELQHQELELASDTALIKDRDPRAESPRHGALGWVSRPSEGCPDMLI